MTTARANHSEVMPKLAALLAGALAVVTGGMVLVGWALDITALKSILPGWVSVKPNTALAFILTGIALLFFSLAPATPLNTRLSSLLSRLARLCGLLAGLVGLLTLSEYVFDWNPGIDQWLFPEPAGTVGTAIPGRMAPETALCFVLLAAGLEIARSPRKTMRASFASVILGVLVTTLALAAILTYFTPALGAYGWWGLTIMAVPTATLFTALGAAMVLVAWQDNVSIWFLDGRITAAFACGLVLLVIIGLTTSRSQVRLHETTDRLAHSEKRLGGITSVLAEVANAQTHTRGYVITGDERFLKSYRSADTRSKEALDALRQLVADSPPQQPRFARLEAQASEALQWFRQVTDTRQTGPAAVRPDQIRHGEDLMDAIRAGIRQMENRERQLLQQTMREWEGVSRFTDTVIVSGTVLSLIVFLTALLALNDSAAERIRVEGMLREEEARFRLAAESASDVIYEWNLGTRVQWFGKIDELMGYGPGEFPRTLDGWANLLHPEDYGRVMTAIEQQLSGEAAYDIEYRVRKRDGAYGAWWVRGTVVRKADGKPWRWIGSVTDITERKLKEEEIRRLHEGLEARIRERTAQLETANARLEQFAYVASHDLQEPLRMVTSYVQLVEKRLADKLDADTREFMGYAVDGALRMQDLILDILAFSRVGTRGQPLARVDSAEVLKEVLALLRNRIAETGAEVTMQSLPIVMADRTQLVQLFQNLIGNAIKFCKDRAPRVRVAAAHEAGQWRFSVTDNGIGIAPEYHGQIFVIFKRLHTRRKYPGTGIGLAICKRIVERHGGEIGVGPAPGGGSVFWFTLPKEPGT